MGYYHVRLDLVFPANNLSSPLEALFRHPGPLDKISNYRACMVNRSFPASFVNHRYPRGGVSRNFLSSNSISVRFFFSTMGPKITETAWNWNKRGILNHTFFNSNIHRRWRCLFVACKLTYKIPMSIRFSFIVQTERNPIEFEDLAGS